MKISSRLSLPTVANCDNCGACCTAQGYLPIHMVGDRPMLKGVNPLPPMLQMELQAVRERFIEEGPHDGPDGPCIWYDSQTRRCKHYDYRPTLCRDGIKAGDTGCLRWRKERGIDRPKLILKNGRLVNG